MEFLKGIKNIIFDLGGVLLNIDPQKTIHEFYKLGISQFMDGKTHNYSNEVFYQMEQGFIGPDEFRNGVNKLLPQNTSDESIDHAWTAMILDFPEERIRILKNLGSEFNLYLFSNTNAIHVDYFEKNFREAHKFDVKTLFKKVFYSNEIGARKPSLSAFHKTISLANIIPEESLFIDDLEANVEGAKQAGLNAYWLKSEEKFEMLFSNYR